MICILRLLTGKTPSSMSQGCFLLVINMEIWSWRMGDLSCKVNVQIQKILYQGKWKLQLGIIILMGGYLKNFAVVPLHNVLHWRFDHHPYDTLLVNEYGTDLYHTLFSYSYKLQEELEKFPCIACRSGVRINSIFCSELTQMTYISLKAIPIAVVRCATMNATMNFSIDDKYHDKEN